jgi:glycosyltransferase involved in cell wall biosynthesis
MISVITPVYNGEKFIEFCIKAVIGQNCSNIEHIIVDGGSADRTIDIVQQYAQNYPHIRWLSEKDKGQSDAINKGINLAKGDIIAILNVDDFYEPNVLNRISKIFLTLPEPSFLVGNCNVWNDKRQLKYVNKPAKLGLVDLLLGFEVNPFPVNPSAYFYHKSLHKIVGLYDIEEHYIMDLDFILKAVQVANVQYVNETWGNFLNIQGTKTVNDARSGKIPQRREQILKKYQQNLPFLQQLLIVFVRNSVPKIKSLYRGLKTIVN